MEKDLQSLGQGIFTTVVEIGTAISLALAATIAHADGVTESATKMELLRGYRSCFWFSAGLMAIPLALSFFLRKGSASETPRRAEEKRKQQEKRQPENRQKVDSLEGSDKEEKILQKLPESRDLSEDENAIQLENMLEVKL